MASYSGVRGELCACHRQFRSSSMGDECLISSSDMGCFDRSFGVRENPKNVGVEGVRDREFRILVKDLRIVTVVVGAQTVIRYLLS